MKLYRIVFFTYLGIKSIIIRFHLKCLYGSKITFGKNVEIGNKFNCYINPHNASAILSSDVKIRSHCSVRVENGAILRIAESVFINNYCSINCMEKIEIGEKTIIGEGVRFYDHNHAYKENRPIKDQGYMKEEIIIGKNIWIGSNVVILKGVQIGDNAVIGAGCIIHKSVEANSIVINNQYQIVKQQH